MAWTNTHKKIKTVQTPDGFQTINCCDNPEYFEDLECNCCTDSADLDNLIAYAKAQGWIP